MYKGKFDQKARQSTVSTQELLAQRNAEAERLQARASQKSASQRQKATMESMERPNAPQPRNTERRVPAAQSPRRPASEPQTPAVKKGPRLGGLIFYTLYFLFILVFFVAVFFGMQWLNGWLIDYQAAQPDVKAEQVYQQLFANPDWENLYVASGAQDSPFEGKEQFVDYMNAKVDAANLTYLETSAGLSNDKKYVVRNGSEKIATFTLKDHNQKEAGNAGLLSAEIPDWQLGGVELFFEREGTYRIEKMESHRALLNGVEVSDDYTIQIATTKADSYLPLGTTGVRKCLQEINGLMAKPTVEIYDAMGNPMEVTYDETTQTFTEGTVSQTIGVEEKTAALGAAESYCKWMIEELTDRATLAKYYEPTSEAYKRIAKLGHYDLWAQDNNGFEFLNEEVTNYVRYSDTLFSCRVTLEMKVNVKIDGSVKTIPYAQSLFFTKDSGSWLCYDSTNEDVSQPVGKVRLTFMQGQTQLVSDFFDTNSKQIITPLITPPQGQVFAGWVREDVNDQGQKVLTLVFQPDSSGTVDIPEGTTLTPMTLYAHFEDANAAQETVPETTLAG